MTWMLWALGVVAYLGCGFLAVVISERVEPRSMTSSYTPSDHVGAVVLMWPIVAVFAVPIWLCKGLGALAKAAAEKASS